MKAFGPGAKSATGWYVRLWPNPGFAFPWKGGRVFFRLFSTKAARGVKHYGVRRRG